MDPLRLPTDAEIAEGTREWPHAPPHRLKLGGVFFVTARTANRRHLLDTPSRRDWFQETLLSLISEFGWRSEAWAILSNHYHLIAHSPPEQRDGALSLKRLVQKLHSFTTKELNRQDGTPGRSRLWQNYRETLLTFQESYMARLNYVHQNAVHHRLVTRASDWKWCSARQFKEAVTPAWVRTVASFKFDRIAVEDEDFDADMVERENVC
jgi:putative transposase